MSPTTSVVPFSHLPVFTFFLKKGVLLYFMSYNKNLKISWACVNNRYFFQPFNQIPLTSGQLEMQKFEVIFRVWPAKIMYVNPVALNAVSKLIVLCCSMDDLNSNPSSSWSRPPLIVRLVPFHSPYFPIRIKNKNRKNACLTGGFVSNIVTSGVSANEKHTALLCHKVLLL